MHLLPGLPGHLAVRATSPEVKQHLTTAATSLLHAAAGVLATHVPDPRSQQTDGPWRRST